VFVYNSKEGKKGKEARDMDSLIKTTLGIEMDTARIKIIDLGKKENASVISRMNKKSNYVFFINTKNPFNANEALTQIKLLKSISPEVYCFDDILESEAPAYETWDTLHVKFFSRFFVEFEDIPTSIIRKKFIESYNQDPVEFTYKGYNDFLFLAEAFSHGRHWLKKSLETEYINEVSGFYYTRDEATEGIYNGYHGVWRYEKLKLYREY
jgi:hypothetical protein